MKESPSSPPALLDRPLHRSLFHSLVKSQTNYFVRLDLAGNYQFVNPAFEEMFGPKEHFLGKHYRHSVHPDDVEKCEHAGQQCVQYPEQAVAIELRKPQTDGSYNATWWEFMAVTNENGEVAEVDALGYDISQDRNIQARLRRTNDLNRLLVTLSNQLINILPETRDATINHALASVTNFLHCKRGLFLQMDKQYTQAQLTHEYAAPHTAPLSLPWRNITINDFPTWLSQVRRHESIVVEDISQLPRSVKHQIKKELPDLVSVVSIPVVHQEVLLGYVGFVDDRVQPRLGEVVESLQLLGTLFGSALHQCNLTQALIRNRGAYELLATHIVDIVSRHTLEGQYTYVTPSCQWVTGYAPSELVGTNPLEYMHPDDHPNVEEDLTRLLAGEVTRKQYRFRRKDDQYRWLEMRAQIAEERGVKEIIASTRDIHQQKLAEQANVALLKKTQQLNLELEASQEELIRNERKFRGLIEHSFDAIIVYDEAGMITYVSPSVESVIGYAPDELVGNSGCKYTFSEDEPTALKLLDEALAHPNVRVSGEMRLAHKDGQIIWVESVLTNLLHDESIRGVVSNFHDVTGQRQGKLAVAEYSKRLELATQSANIGIWDWYIPENRLMWDIRASRILGLEANYSAYYKESVAEVIDKWLEIIHPEDQERVRNKMEEALQHAQSLAVEYRIIRPDNQEIRYVKIYAKILRQRQPLRMTGALRDTTNINTTEQQLRSNIEELQKTNAELDQFVYSTSHNLRSPLASILGLVSILQGETDYAEREHYLQLIEASIHRLDSTISNIIDYSRNTRVEVATVPINFHEMITEIIDNLYFLLRAVNVRVTTRLPDAVSLTTDAHRLKIIISNLLSNAIKYFNPQAIQPWVEISVVATEEGVLILIEDNGIGIPGGIQDKIFDMFFRASERSSGSGLGLYIVKETVNKLGGTISMTSQVGKGSAFTVCLPSLADQH